MSISQTKETSFNNPNSYESAETDGLTLEQKVQRSVIKKVIGIALVAISILSFLAIPFLSAAGLHASTLSAALYVAFPTGIAGTSILLLCAGEEKHIKNARDKKINEYIEQFFLRIGTGKKKIHRG